jgi:hypothetical protein
LEDSRYLFGPSTYGPDKRCCRQGNDRKHLSRKLHLLVALKYSGSEGNASSFSHVTGGLGLGRDSILNYIECTVTTLDTFQKRSNFWSSAAERLEISQ